MATRPPLLNDSVTGTCLPFIRGWCFLKVIFTEGKQILDWKKFTDGLVSSLVTNDVKFIKADSLGMVSANEQRFARPSFFHGIVKPLHIKQSGLRKIYAVFVISLRITIPLILINLMDTADLIWLSMEMEVTVLEKNKIK